MANRGTARNRTLLRKANQQKNAGRTLLIEFARGLGAKNPDTFASEQLSNYIQVKKPALGRAVDAVKELGADGIEKLKMETTPQAVFLCALMGIN